MDLILKPFSMLLIMLYNLFNSYGIALMIFALIVKVILFPVSLKGKKSMIKTNMLSGQVQKLQKQYANNRTRYNEEVQKLYAREKVNPSSGCIWTLIPMFFLIALFYVIREPLTNLMGVPKDMIATVAAITGVANEGAYPQMAMLNTLRDPAVLAEVKAALGEAGQGLFALNTSFLGIELAETPTWKFWANGFTWSNIGLFLLPLVSTVISFLSMQVTLYTNKMNQDRPESAAQERTNKSMAYIMPLMSLWIGFTVPAALTVYWIAQYVVSMGTEYISGLMLKKDYEKARLEAIEMEKRAKEEEKQRKEEARLARARRLEEEKLNRKNRPEPEVEPDQVGVNREDSRVGIRTYARGRAYIPDRYETVPYWDPNIEIHAKAEIAWAERRERDAKRQAKKDAREARKEAREAKKAERRGETVQQPEQPKKAAAPKKNKGGK